MMTMKLVETVKLRSKEGFFYVSLMPVDGEEKPKTVFKSSSESAARNVAKQFAKQYKCMVAFEKSTTVEEDDPDPQEAL